MDKYMYIHVVAACEYDTDLLENLQIVTKVLHEIPIGMALTYLPW